jgi:orotidine-5'-phosphate decarboxylase
MSFDRLQDRIDEMRNPTVVGLDPALEHIPPDILARHIAGKGETLLAAAAAVYEWGAGLIDALYDIVPAVKPQSAYYEALGPEGVRTLKMTCDYAKSKGMYVIVDGKRNDIGSTAEAYSAAYLGTVTVGSAELRPFDADALTVNAYLGSDGLRPFIDMAVKYDKAVFALVKTSNPSAGELQDRFIDGTGDGSGRQGDGSSVLLHKHPKTVERHILPHLLTHS